MAEKKDKQPEPGSEEALLARIDAVKEKRAKALEEVSGPEAVGPAVAEGGGGTVTSEDVPKKRASKKSS